MPTIARASARLPHSAVLPVLALLGGCPEDASPTGSPARQQAERALADAKALDDPLERQLAVLDAVTGSRAFPDAEVASICEAELASPVLRERCTRFLERTHLRGGAPAAHAPGGAAAPVPPGVCRGSEGSALDHCLAERALAEASGPIEAVAPLLAAIAEPARRGQAVCAVLQAGAMPGSADRLAELESLVPLAPTPWDGEAWSILASDLPFRLDRSCRRGGSPGCEALLAERLLPAAVRGCDHAGAMAAQCFDHLCAAMAELAVSEAREEPAPILQAVLAARAGQVGAMDARALSQPRCAALWAGRKAAQILGEAQAAVALCDRLLDGDRDACLSGLAEESLRGWLRAHPAAGETELVDLVTGPSSALAAATPDALEPWLSCAAFSVLTFELEASLSARRLPGARLLGLRDARPGCAWARVPVGGTTRAPSLLLLTLDATPAEALAPWSGSAGACCETLAGLARRGTVLLQARAVAPMTLPTHASILTGLRPAAHGVWTDDRGTLGDAPVTLAEALAQAGYRTAAFVASDVLDDRSGLAQGFSAYRDPVADGRACVRDGPLPRLDAAEVTGRAIAWLDEALPGGEGPPFFLWVHYFDADDPAALPPGAPGDARDAALAEVDAQIGRLLTALRARDRERDCVVAAIGDHGVGAGYRHVPLLLAGPGIASGLALGDPRSQEDLMPTLLELLGQPPLLALDGESFAGSLATPGGRP